MSNQQQNPASQSPKRLNRRRLVLLWTLGMTVLLLLAIIVSQQLWLWTVIRPDTASDTLVLYALSTLNFVAFVVFSFIFIRSLLKLRRERLERQLGSKIKTRLLVYFIAISFLPITARAVFSFLFLNRSLEKWFNPFPQAVVREAREVQREAIATEIRNLLDTGALLAVMLNKQPESEWQQTLDQMMVAGRFSAIEIVTEHGEVRMKSEANLPDNDRAGLEMLLERARQSGGVIGESLADGKGFDLISVPLSQNQSLLISPAKRSETDLNDKITGSQSEYQNLGRRRIKVRWLGLSTLGLLTLMLLFVSSWVAIYLARGIATPIKALAEASKEIARGNLSHRVNTIAEDELALLADSFNRMSSQLEDNRTSIEAGSAALREKNLTLEERRDYIETILESLSTGVISLDEEDRVTTINAAASRMLKLKPTPTGEQKLESLLGAEDWLVMNRLLRRARRNGQSAEEAQLEGGGNGTPGRP